MAKKTKKTKRPAVSDLPSNQLAREVQRRLRSLQRKRDQLHAQLEDVESQIAELQTAGTGNGRAQERRPRGGGPRRQPRNQQPLPEAMASVMDKKKPMSAGEIAEAVQKAGYRTTASNFRPIVSNTLAKDDRFKKVRRGKYLVA